MRILVANDDGADAPGLRLLAQAASALGSDVWVVAPDRKWTAAGHQLSFDRDLSLTTVSEHRYVCSGAPADCIIAAMTILFADGPKPDLVLAGVNDKRNVGEDLAYSGTIAIAREATFWGVPAISLSRADGAVEAPTDLDALRRLLLVLWHGRAQWSGDGSWLSINLPARLPAPLAQARTGRDKIGAAVDVLETTTGRVRYRLRRGRSGTTGAGDENARLAAGQISVIRYCWFEENPLAETILDEWRSALGPALPGPGGRAVLK
ncbi:MAG TPA: 5'/3'-nucleotidase SurE [Casimicrobiaceae bacterium]|nr:5'/3'-nucleotidase SurE [Casimicrobiaceae bacterium]